jgi:tetratricopeptide (TPR) repeat protein
MNEPLKTFNEAELLQLLQQAGADDHTEANDYTEAIAYCEEALAAGAPPRFWRRQLAYSLFLDERGPAENQWERAPAVFEELVRDEPDDADLRFWHGYLLMVPLAGFDELGMAELRRTIELNPAHAYGNLVLAAYERGAKRIPYYMRTLASQPNNYRALRDMAKDLASLGRHREEREALESILSQPPFVDDTAPAILLPYVNAVLTGAYWEQDTRDEARVALREGLSST